MFRQAQHDILIHIILILKEKQSIKDSEIINILQSTPILVYHKIDPRNEIGINSISPNQFKEQIQFLVDNRYQTFTFKNILNSKQHSRRLIITFDDGYESVYKYAYPILKEFGYKAVVFVIAGYINQWNSWDANLGGIKFRHLSGDQIKEMAMAGWEIGSHSVHHQPLPHLNRKRLYEEVTLSFKVLKEMTGNEISTFSYPFGMQNSRVQKAINDAGFKFGCRNISWNSGIDNLFSIPRIPVYKFDTIKTLQKKLELSANPFEKLKLFMLNWPARFTPLYQILFRKQLFLE